MNREMSPEQLDHEIQQLIESSGQFSGHPNSLVGIAAELRLLPSQEFRNRVKDDLLAQAEELETSSVAVTVEFPFENRELMPSLAQRQFSVMPADPRSFLFSFLSHAAVVILIASGIWVGDRTVVKKKLLTSDLTYIPMPLGREVPHGGGGGGDHSTIQASHGTPPRFSDEQLAPPAIVVRNPSPKLQVEASVLGPPQVKLPQSNRIGDLMSPNVVIPSNGTGSRGGMGSKSGTGIGDGLGAGVGPGYEAGFGGGPFHPGNGVSAPRAIYDPNPEYSDEARRARYQGTVVLSLIVDPSGRARSIHIARSLGMGLDEKAVEAVQKWQFAPGMKYGHAVTVQVNVEVNFRLY